MSSAVQESSKIPERIGIYRLEEEIGSGAMGKVYRATHETLGKEVALKLLHTDRCTVELQERFVQEGIAASRVRHPNVVEVLDAGTAGETSYLAMQLLEGETLADCLKRQGRLPITYAIDLILPVCAALLAAHDAGVLHRDLKPANVFLNEVGRGQPEPMLLDFGISKILGPVEASLTQNPGFLGTPFYIAPEQADGSTATPYSDQYSLALTLYEMLLGVRPFEKYRNSLVQLLRHVAEGDIRPPRDLDASISADLDETLLRALHQNPKARFPSIREFGAALLPFASAARRTLWQHSFIDAERTMTSVNAPVSNSRSSRRIEVSVERVSPAPLDPSLETDAGLGERATVHAELREDAASENGEDAQREEFLSHSLLFGAESESTDSFDASQSSVSRRYGARTARFAPSQQDYSQEPSERLSGSWDDGRGALSTEPDGSLASEGRGSRTTLFSGAASKPEGVWSRSSRIAVALVAAAALGLAVLGGMLLAESRSESATAASYSVSVKAEPNNAQIELDGQAMGSGRFEGNFPRDGQMHRLTLRSPGFVSATVVFQDQAPPALIRLEALDAGAPPMMQSPETEPSSAPKNGTPEENSSAKEDSSSPQGAHTTAHAGAPRAAAAREKSQGSTPVRTKTGDDRGGTASGSSSPDESASQKGSDSPKRDAASIPTGNLDPWAQ